MKTKLTLQQVSLLMYILVLFYACQKHDNENPITIKTIEVDRITATRAIVTGEIVNMGNGITDHGVLYSTNPNEKNGSKVSIGKPNGIGLFTVILDNLEPGKTYYVQTYCEQFYITIHGDELPFTTADGLPKLTTADVINIKTNSSTCGGNILDNGGFDITSRGICFDTSNNPTIENNNGFTTNGNGSGSFTSSLKGLTINTTYYVRAYATNKIGTTYGNEQNFKTHMTGLKGTLTDIDGNTYKWVGIGSQAWMAENLKVKHYPNGTAIQFVYYNSRWAELEFEEEAYCYYNDLNTSPYGALYTYEAAKNACPDGWHLPSDSEWTALVNNIGNDGHIGTVGIALKATSGWAEFGNGTDNYGFAALPGGFRHMDTGESIGEGKIGYWWSSTITGYYASYHYLDNTKSYLGSKSHWNNPSGYSVRCVRD